mgnify:FL=1
MDWWGYPSSGICKLFVTVRAVWHDGVCVRGSGLPAAREGCEHYVLLPDTLGGMVLWGS